MIRTVKPFESVASVARGSVTRSTSFETGARFFSFNFAGIRRVIFLSGGRAHKAGQQNDKE
jgi:hypothetical protein